MQKNSQKLNSHEYQDALKYTFEHFDSNKDKDLDKNEFGKMIMAIQKTVPFNITKELVEYLFKKFD